MIERQYNDLKSRHTEAPKKTSEHEAVEQVGQGQIPTGFLQKQALTEENGPSDQKILENPSAPVIFTSSNEPPGKKAKKQSSNCDIEVREKKETSDTKKKSKPNLDKKSEEEQLKYWWYLGDD